MKKIGILYGVENTFPHAFVERINKKKIKGVTAEAVQIGSVRQAMPAEYAVIIDRISQDVPFYRAYLKNAALCGTAVINNPFWWSADEKFFNSCLAETLGVPVPKTVLLPSKERPRDTTETSFRNLKFPMDWHEMFDYVGFPAYLKPYTGEGGKQVYKVSDPQDLWNKHEQTGQRVMMLQEEIVFSDYFRCYCIGQREVCVMPYEPRNPHHLRYATMMKTAGAEGERLLATLHDYVIRLSKALGYDFNMVEFAVRDGVPYAIDLCNPAPDADFYSVGQENFEWLVEAAANLAIEKARQHRAGKNNLTWGTFVRNSAAELPDSSRAETTRAKEAGKVPRAGSKKRTT